MQIALANNSRLLLRMMHKQHRRMGARDLIFISYSHEDTVWLDRLRVTLKPYEIEGRLAVWADPHINVGDRDAARPRRRGESLRGDAGRAARRVRLRRPHSESVGPEHRKSAGCCVRFRGVPLCRRVGQDCLRR